MREGERPRTTEEATEVRLVTPDEVPWDELAFWSTAAALRDAITPAGPASAAGYSSR